MHFHYLPEFPQGTGFIQVTRKSVLWIWEDTEENNRLFAHISCIIWYLSTYLLEIRVADDKEFKKSNGKVGWNWEQKVCFTKWSYQVWGGERLMVYCYFSFFFFQ